jgi:outer membrane protein
MKSVVEECCAMKFVSSVVLLVLLFTAAPAARAQDTSGPVPLSLRQALALAASQGYDVQQARYRFAQARGQSLEGWSGFLPRLTISENYVRSNDPVFVFGTKLRQGVFAAQDFDLRQLNDPSDIENFATALQIQQPLFNVDAVFGKAAASAAATAGRYQLAWTERTVALHVEKAYYGLVLSRRQLAAIEGAVRSAEAHYAEVKAAFDQGLVSEADLLASRVRLGELQDQRLVAANAIDDAADGLRLLLGLEDTAVIEPTDSLTVVDFDPEAPGANAPVSSRSDLRALEYLAASAHRRSWMRRGEWIPKLNAFGTWQWNASAAFGQDASDWTVGVQLEWNLFDGLGKFGRARQAGAAAAEAGVQYRQALARGAAEIRRALRDFQTAKERIDVAETAVAQARESLRIMEDRFKEGMERSSDLLAREAVYTNATLRLEKAKYDLVVAASELKYYRGARAESE